MCISRKKQKVLIYIESDYKTSTFSKITWLSEVLDMYLVVSNCRVFLSKMLSSYLDMNCAVRENIKAAPP